MYTKVDCGRELLERVEKMEDTVSIGSWAFGVYMKHILEIDSELSKVLRALLAMELGPEFTLSYKRLNEIANDLISEKDEINLDY